MEGFIDLSLEIKQTIYRIIQEALANVTKHSMANRVDIVLRCGENSVEFSLSDAGMGLDSMRERVESLNGDFNIQSEPGQGAKICITIPIE